MSIRIRIRIRNFTSTSCHRKRGKIIVLVDRDDRHGNAETVSVEDCESMCHPHSNQFKNHRGSGFSVCVRRHCWYLEVFVGLQVYLDDIIRILSVLIYISKQPLR
jgi:hypothetical protein